MMLNCFINPLMALGYETTHAQLGLQRVRVNFLNSLLELHNSLLALPVERAAVTQQFNVTGRTALP